MFKYMLDLGSLGLSLHALSTIVRHKSLPTQEIVLSEHHRGSNPSTYRDVKIVDYGFFSIYSYVDENYLTRGFDQEFKQYSLKPITIKVHKLNGQVVDVKPWSLYTN